MSNYSQLYFIGQPSSLSDMLDYFTAIDAVYPSGSPAVASGLNNHPLVNFNSAADAYVDFQGVLPPSGVLGVSLLWVSDVDTGDVEWRVSWERDNPTTGVPQANLMVDSFAAAKTVLSPAPTAVGLIREALLAFTPAEMGGLQPGEAYRLRVRRSAGVAPDTLAGSARLFRVILGAV